MSTTSETRNRLQGLHEAASCACFNLRSASRAITQYYNGCLQPSGLLATQFSLLATLAAQNEAVPISTLAGMLAMDRTTLARNLRPLQRDRLVRITRDQHDHRIQLASISEKGSEALSAALPLWRQAQQHVLGVFGAERWNVLLTDLNTISRSAKIL